jgi:hypothetical protein
MMPSDYESISGSIDGLVMTKFLWSNHFSVMIKQLGTKTLQHETLWGNLHIHTVTANGILYQSKKEYHYIPMEALITLNSQRNFKEKG